MNIHMETGSDGKMLIVEGKESEMVDNYELKMFKSNVICGFLDFDVVSIDNKRRYSYDISGATSIRDAFGSEAMNRLQVIQLVTALKNAVSELNTFLIDYDKIFLTPDTVFLKDGKYNFCFCMENDISFTEGLRDIMEYILERIDYRDNEAVVLAYKLYHQVVRDGIGIEALDVEGEKRDTFERNAWENVAKKEIISYKDYAEEYDIREDKCKSENDASKKNFSLTGQTIFFAALCGISFVGIFVEGMLPLPDTLLKCVVLISMAAGAYSLMCDYRKYKGNAGKKTNEAESDAKTYGAKTEDSSGEQTMLLEPQCPRIIYSMGGEDVRVSVDRIPFTIGSGRDVDCLIKRRSVSRLHARIFNEGSRYFIEDLRSTNGTRVDNKRLAHNQVVELFDGSIIEIADVEAEFKKALD